MLYILNLYLHTPPPYFIIVFTIIIIIITITTTITIFILYYCSHCAIHNFTLATSRGLQGHP